MKTKIKSLVVTLLFLFAGWNMVYGHGGPHYFQGTAIVKSLDGGSGKVYVAGRSFDGDISEITDWAADSYTSVVENCDGDGDGDGNSGYAYLNFYGKPDAGSCLYGWYSDEDCSTGFQSSDNPWKKTTSDDKKDAGDPEQLTYYALFTFPRVVSKAADGAVTITASPDAEGTANVTFNVSGTNTADASLFTYELIGGDGHWVMGDPSYSSNVITVPVTYTAQNIHTGDDPASTVTVTLKADKADDSSLHTSASGTATAKVDLTPTFALAAGSSLDWSYDTDGETLLETVYVGTTLAASERDRTQNKLVLSDPENQTMARDHATWTATIIGTNADQFKFANGTQTVSGSYTDALLDVIFAPTAEGESDQVATLHVVASYTDASSVTRTCTKDVTLRGHSKAASFITFKEPAHEQFSANESYAFGDIIGTNSKNVTIAMSIYSITNPNVVWSGDVEHFEFNTSSIDFNQANQNLTFVAHPAAPVAEATDYTATLTITATGSESEEVTGVLTLTCHAVPLTATTVTWNWATLDEYSTATNPVTTNSNGTVTITKNSGDAVTYNAAAKSATVAYLHHEPGKTASFTVSIPQTDTYTAFEQTYESSIAVTNPVDVFIDTQAKYDEYLTVTSWESFDESTNTFYTWYESSVHLAWQGQSKLTFDFVSGNSDWRLTEKYADNSTNVIHNGAFVEGRNEFSVSPKTVGLYIYGRGYIKDIHYYEPDYIKTDVEEAALVNDNGTIINSDITATLAKQQVTVSLNEAARNYFELRAAGKSSGSSIVFNDADGLAPYQEVEKVVTVALKAGANAAEAAAATAGNACLVTFADSYTYNHEERSLPIQIQAPYDITYKHGNGTYLVTYSVDTEHPQRVSSSDYVKHMTTVAPAQCEVTLSAPTPASGYTFQGWKVNGTLVSLKQSYTVVLMEETTVEAVFGAGDGNFQVEDALYDDLNDAAAAAALELVAQHLIIVAQNASISTSGTYTIPAGVTMLVPFDAANTCYTTTTVNEAYSTPSAYRTLTLADGVIINVEGAISVSAKFASGGNETQSGAVTGKYGAINMLSGSTINIKNGAALYCWGYIYGAGEIKALSGSQVYEGFCHTAWQGGTNSTDMQNNVFPVGQYYVQNIEVSLEINKGATETLYALAYAGGNNLFSMDFIGETKGLFRLQGEGAKVVKHYDPVNDRQCYDVYGQVSLSNVVVSSENSANYVMPLTNNLAIHMHPNSDVTIAYDMCVMPGCSIVVDNNATLRIANSANVYVYDRAAYANAANYEITAYASSGSAAAISSSNYGKYAGSAYIRPLWYSPTNATIATMRLGTTSGSTAADKAKNAALSDNMLSAAIQIDGTVIVAGHLFTTEGGANIFSTGSGEIQYTTLASSEQTVTYQASFSGYTGFYHHIPVSLAQLRHENGEYLSTSGAAVGTIIQYANGHWGWKVTWIENDESTTKYSAVQPDAAWFDSNTPSPVSTSCKTFAEWEKVTNAANQEITWTAVYTVNTDDFTGKEVSVDVDETVKNTVVHEDGKLTIADGITLTTTNLILEAAGEESGQIIENGTGAISATNVYYDLKLNSPRRHWHSFGVPWVVNLATNPLKEVETGRTLTLGNDYDIIWYNTETRASSGPGAHCWEYVAHHDKTLTPGQGYMIAFTRDVQTVRFVKASGAPIIYDQAVTVSAAGEGDNQGINALANPMAYHATLNAGPAVGYVHDGGEIGSDGYEEYDIEGKSYVVGRTVYIQVRSNTTVAIDQSDADPISKMLAPARRKAVTDKEYLSLSDYYRVSISGATTDGGNVYVLPEEGKKDTYVVGHDLAKFGMNSSKPQLWVNRYDTKLGLNTIAPIDGEAEFPINLYAPEAGEYTIANAFSPDDEYTVYLTREGQAIWNLSTTPYTLTLSKGTVKGYGIRLTKKAPQIATGVDEAVVDGKNTVATKVLINGQVFIIRGDKVYSMDGQLVK